MKQILTIAKRLFGKQSTSHRKVVTGCEDCGYYSRLPLMGNKRCCDHPGGEDRIAGTARELFADCPLKSGPVVVELRVNR